MTDQGLFGESDHGPLSEDDVLARAIGASRDESPSRDLWAGIAARIRSAVQ